MPPSKIGNALNALMSSRIDAALTRDVPYIHVHTQQVISACRLVISTIPGWDTGTEINPSEDSKFNDDVRLDGCYIALIELPFVIHPKSVTLRFKHPLTDIKTSVQVGEMWNVADPVEPGMFYSSRFQRCIEASDMSSVCHYFSRANLNSLSLVYIGQDYCIKLL